MLGRFVRDESGVAMGLAIIVMVLVGVMGAGLLVFVRNDLEAVVEVNQGQKAFDIADAGVQVAKQQLLGDKIPAHYDVDNTGNSNYLNAGCNIDPADPTYGGGESVVRTPSGENWSPEDGGQTRSFAGGQHIVTIRWLNPNPPAVTPNECKAPKLGTPPPGTDYFKVVSTGTSGGATRRIETIYETYSLDVPRAYYTPGKININGSACIIQVSLFSLSDVTFAGGGNGCDGTGSNFRGDDIYYGDWNRPPYNTQPRPVALAGVGSAGDVTGNPKLADGVASEGRRDFDRLTSPPFKQAPSAGDMSFPFDLNAQPDPQQLCDEARAQGNYISNATTGNANLTSWPSSSPNTVVCYEFTNTGSSHTLFWKVDVSPSDDLTGAGYPGCKGPIQDGTLVVRGGGFSVSPNTDLLRGIVVVRATGDSVNSEVEDAGLSGRGCLDGFINSTGPITIAGSITPSNSNDVNNRPGLFGVRTWSWRELYG
jgi:hypothetical protein